MDSQKNDVQKILQFATKLATQAGIFLVEQYARQDSASISVRTSPKKTHLAEDKTMDQWLIQRIQEKYPEHQIVTEESGNVNAERDVCWVIDPIDGSVNFQNRNPFVAISLAVLIQGKVCIGVVEAPLLGEQFVAVRGQGATVNGTPLHVSSTEKLSDAYLVTCDGGMTDRTEVFSVIVRNYYDQVKDLRKLGSAALECAWVASGRADAYITMAIDPWDVAAGVLLIEEAGGKVTTFESGIWEPKQQDIICSNGLLHDQLLDRIWT